MNDPRFQSRNRGSFDFKWHLVRSFCIVCRRFNLVIEVLLISSQSRLLCQYRGLQFQSRNRGSFDFKSSLIFMTNSCTSWFQSRNRGSFDFKPSASVASIPVDHRFNLVIEVLLISSRQRVKRSKPHSPIMFQSRNRGSFDFKL